MCRILKTFRDKYQTCFTCIFMALLVFLGLLSILWMAVLGMLVGDDMFEDRTRSIDPLHRVIWV